MMVGMSLYMLFEVVNDVWGSASKSVMFVRYAPPCEGGYGIADGLDWARGNITIFATLAGTHPADVVLSKHIQ